MDFSMQKFVYDAMSALGRASAMMDKTISILIL